MGVFKKSDGPNSTRRMQLLEIEISSNGQSGYILNKNVVKFKC
jgi:hypothetical protein